MLTPQLKPHQLRPQDPIEQLDPKYRDSYITMGGTTEKTGYQNPGFPPESEKAAHRNPRLSDVTDF